MEPVFALQWSEFKVAEELQKWFPKSKGYSVFVPLSRQEKGVDIALLKKSKSGASKAVTIQVKSARFFLGAKAKRETTKTNYYYYFGFSRFITQAEVDFYVLCAPYPPDRDRTKKVNRDWYQYIMLVFTNEEMKDFLKSNCKTVTGAPDSRFAFGFDNERAIDFNKRKRVAHPHRLFWPPFTKEGFD